MSAKPLLLLAFVSTIIKHEWAQVDNYDKKGFVGFVYSIYTGSTIREKWCGLHPLKAYYMQRNQKKKKKK